MILFNFWPIGYVGKTPWGKLRCRHSRISMALHERRKQERCNADLMTLGDSDLVA